MEGKKKPQTLARKMQKMRRSKAIPHFPESSAATTSMPCWSSLNTASSTCFRRWMCLWQKKRNSQATQLKDFLPELQDHRITALVTVSHRSLRDQADDFVVLVSKKGFAKKVSVDRFRGLRPGRGLQAMRLENGDEVRWAHKAVANSALVVVTAEGYMLRVSLGQDWSLSSAKGPGRCVMKMRKNSQDYIAASSISQLSQAEIIKIQEKAAAKAGATGLRDSEAQPKAENEESEKEEADEKEEVGDESEEEEKEEKEDKEPKDADEEDTKKENEIAARDDVKEEGADAVQAPHAATDMGQCVLLITECGMGARIPLSLKRLSLGRRGGAGKRVLKVADSDNVVAACVVSANDLAEPVKPAEALQLYLREHTDANEESYNYLPAEDLTRYQEMAERAKQKYAEDMDAYRKQDFEEVLLGSNSGAVTRIKVSTVPIITRVIRGRVVAKTKGNDHICVASLLSSIEDEREDDGVKEPGKSAQSQSQSAPSRPRRPTNNAAGVAESEAPVGASDVAAVLEPKVPTPVERTPRSKLTQSLVKRRRSQTSPRLDAKPRSPRSPVHTSIHLLKPKLRVLKSPFYTKTTVPKVSTFDMKLGRFVSSGP
mmetsp:Transcript_22270/g.39056  ORF Transcript_22270/g.39056 Transcript_22270/m.39056 type:complete len:600 (-) Transcript_22270:226-2025(-)